MPISRTAIEERLALLKTERQRLLDNANAFNGAIQECEHWLIELQREPERTNGEALRVVGTESQPV